ncbi:hypothetical protein [Azospirillum soli]|uniref:hypothetical protein n=1 Tax=Azospirillum soli TaxID=1304799 RepID=UPI001AEB8429|nr:hypothetical protein [Azospirillum soli]MBP2316807.1 putative phage tail protein [Azospirillum soli]
MAADEVARHQAIDAKARPGRRLMAVGLLVALMASGVFLYRAVMEPAPSDAAVRADLIAMIREAAPRERLEKDIAAALDQDVPEQAEELLDVADLIGVPLDPALRARWIAETTGWRAAARTTRRAAMGFVTGQGEDAVSRAAAVVSDLTVVGDVRDLAGQASRMVKGETVDELTLGLSIAGVAMTAGTVVTAGGALPAKTGLSLAKLARKTGALSAKFQAEFGRIVARAVDLPAFRQAVRDVPWYRVDELGAAARRHAARVDTREVETVLASVGAINQVLAPSRTLAVLRHVDDVTDLQNAERAATLLGKPVSGALRLTGKTVLTTVARTAKISMAMLGALVAAVLGALSFLLGAVMALGAVLRLGTLARGLFRTTIGRVRRPRPQPL